MKRLATVFVLGAAVLGFATPDLNPFLELDVAEGPPGTAVQLTLRRAEAGCADPGPALFDGKPLAGKVEREKEAGDNSWWKFVYSLTVPEIAAGKYSVAVQSDLTNEFCPVDVPGTVFTVTQPMPLGPTITRTGSPSPSRTTKTPAPTHSPTSTRAPSLSPFPSVSPESPPSTPPVTSRPPATRSATVATTATTSSPTSSPTGSSQAAQSLPPPTTSQPPQAAPAVVVARSTTEATSVPRAPLPAGLRPASSYTIEALAQAVVIAVALVLGMVLIGFPAEYFNKLFEEHRHRLRPRWWPRPPVRVAPRLLVVLAVASAGLLFTLASGPAPSLALTLGSVAGFGAAFLVTTVAYELPVEIWRRRHAQPTGTLKAVPAAIVVALVCAALSRWQSFQPAYVYGVFAVFLATGRKDLDTRPAGRAVFSGCLTLLGVSLAALLMWLSLSGLTVATHSFGLYVVDLTLATIWAAGIQSVLFALTPFAFMDGPKLLRWRKLVYVAVAIVAATGFCYTVLTKDPQPFDAGELAAAGWLFAGFLLVTALFWLLCHLLGRRDSRLRPAVGETS
ncbi:hypothetical protein SAMN05444920_13466 [Nonomuraea solani]|uniref:Uncharacterized protein n=1 Tax=Nonomuraea solani TaxID=1144553 RepID=A0A1H6EZP7_9ACTN|nr:FGLLP motif-containing membrane protein [Nonomuraea solani]SEH03262.1 hypothetical protein SAMN05444920_13466 [Nonomuraea solani]